MAPIGTVTVNDDVEADVTLALVAPKYTTLSFGMALKFAPLIVTIVPMGPKDGAKEEIVVGCPEPLGFHPFRLKSV